MRALLIVAFSLQLISPVYSQNADSISRSVDSSEKVFQQINKKFQQYQDTLYRQQSFNDGGNNLDQYLADAEEKQTSERRRQYIRMGLAMVFIIALVIGFARKRKIQNKR